MSEPHKTKGNLPELFSVEEVSEYLKLSIRTVRNKLSTKELGSIKIGGRVYCTEKHIREYIRRNGTERPSK